MTKFLTLFVAFVVMITVLPMLKNALFEGMEPDTSKTDSEVEAADGETTPRRILPRTSISDALREPLDSLTGAFAGIAMYLGIVVGAIFLLVLAVTTRGAILDHFADKREAAAKERLNRKVNEALAGNPSYVELQDLERSLKEMEETDKVKERLASIRALMEQIREETEEAELADIDRRLAEVKFLEEPAAEPETEEPKALPPGQDDPLRAHVSHVVRRGRHTAGQLVRRRVRRS